MTSGDSPRISRRAMTTADRAELHASAAQLQRRWQGQFDVQTIERFMAESIDILASKSGVTTWLPVLVERLTDDRLRELMRLQSSRTEVGPSVLFLCPHNAFRSPMAAGFMRRLGGDRVDVYSGGSEPATHLSAAAVAAMAERGIDISRELPQPWAEEVIQAAGVVVTMGDACPVYPGKRYVEWELDSPGGESVEEVRPIRDEIEGRVRALLAELEVEPGSEDSASGIRLNVE
jgi:arsenate reductase (thioredoxin)